MSLPTTLFPFAHSLLAAIATAASLRYVRPSTPPYGGAGWQRDLWLGAADETSGECPGKSAAYTVAMPSLAPRGVGEFAGVARAQFTTRGPMAGGVAFAQSAAVAAAMLNPSGSPKLGWAFPALAFPTGGQDPAAPATQGEWTAKAFDFLQGPTPIATDEAGRAVVAFNVEILYARSK